MKLDFILIIGIIVNTMFAVLYPAQIFGDEALWLSGNNEDLTNYISVNETGLITGYDSNTGELTSNRDNLGNIQEGVDITDGNNGIFTFSSTLSFIDWVKESWKLLKIAAMFVIGFIFLLWNLVFPLNFLVGVPFSLLYLYSIVSFITGRGQ